MNSSTKSLKSSTWFGSVFDKEWCKDVTIAYLPVDHIVVYDWVEKLISLSTRPERSFELGTFYKVVSLRNVHYSPFFDRLFKRPARRYVEISLIDNDDASLVIYLPEEAAYNNYVEVSRIAHQ